MRGSNCYVWPEPESGRLTSGLRPAIWARLPASPTNRSLRRGKPSSSKPTANCRCRPSSCRCSFVRRRANRSCLTRVLLPKAFPDHSEILDAQVDRDIAAALAARPELVELDVLYRKTSVELTQATNMLLPKLDALMIASKDVGEPAEEINNKGPFELEAGLYGEVPLQRREAEGKIEAARAKLAQLRVKREFAVNKVTAEVQDAVSALRAAEERIDRAGINLRLADESLQLARGNSMPATSISWNSISTNKPRSTPTFCSSKRRPTTTSP